MCIICVELIKQKMSIMEAGRNLGEMVNDKREDPKTLKHYKKLKEAIEFADWDELEELIEEGYE